MISEKKYKLEVEKLMKIINKLREERNLSLINYQKISSDILQFKKFSPNVGGLSSKYFS